MKFCQIAFWFAGNAQPASPKSPEVMSCMSSESVHPREDEADFTDASPY